VVSERVSSLVARAAASRRRHFVGASDFDARESRERRDRSKTKTRATDEGACADYLVTR